MRRLVLGLLLVSSFGILHADPPEDVNQIGSYEVSCSDVVAGRKVSSTEYCKRGSSLARRIYDCACLVLETKLAGESRPDPDTFGPHEVSSVAPGYTFVRSTHMTCDGSDWDLGQFQLPSAWAAISTGEEVECIRIYNNIERFLRVDLSLDDSMLSRQMIQCLGIAALVNRVSQNHPLYKRAGGFASIAPDHNFCVVMNRAELAQSFYWDLVSTCIQLSFYGCDYDSKYFVEEGFEMAGDLEITAPVLERFEDSVMLLLNVSTINFSGYSEYRLVRCEITAQRDGSVSLRFQKRQTWSYEKLVELFDLSDLGEF